MIPIGFNGLRMWDLCQKVQLAQPPQIQSPQDPITAVAWLVPNNGIQETLCCRTALGYIAIWRQHPNTVVDFEEVVFRKISGGHEVMAIASDTGNGTGNCIILATQDRCIQAWTLDSRNHFSNMFSVQLMTSIPRAVYIQGCDVTVFGMYNGDIHILRSDDRMVVKMKTTGMMIGSACIDRLGSLFVIDNTISRFSLHRLSDGSCIRTYDMKPLKTHPKQVTFAEDSTVIVRGSDNGFVYVFEKNTRNL
ncbi:hypothetical protein EDD16DRAFT_1490743 [Pisolithus croceorrhizus]|nr:hypothetical protein EDD16DRAFT_1490743 [Pisolithus croceorrhizus]